MEIMGQAEPSTDASESWTANGRRLITPGDWREQLPVLGSGRLRMREPRNSDAAALCAMFNEDVARYVSPPPSTTEAFERCIAWMHRQRAAGTYVCFAATEAESDTPIGLFQMHAIRPAFAVAEWGFAIKSSHWGTGVFVESADLMLAFAFDVLGVRRLEARSAVLNDRAGRALRKIGATPEAVLRKAFLCNGERLDQVLYTIADTDWEERAD
jgi:RimJ/RimL family protein N-acetyltransferase